MARARRWVGGLAEMEMRWISEVGVRWGREGGVDGGFGGFGGGEVEGDGDGEGEGEVGGGVLGEVVEMVRVEIVGVMVGERRWRGRVLGLGFAVEMGDLPPIAWGERRGCGW